MNPEDFANLAMNAELECEMALLVLAGDIDLSQPEQVYDQLVEIFVGPVRRFIEARGACNQFIQRSQIAYGPFSSAVRLPRGVRLILNGLRSEVLASGNAGNDPRAVARVIVGSCGPRYHRALQILRAATKLCWNQAAFRGTGALAHPMLIRLTHD